MGNLGFLVGKASKPTGDNSGWEVTSSSVPLFDIGVRPATTHDTTPTAKTDFVTFTPLPPLLSTSATSASQTHSMPLYTLTITSYISLPSATPAAAQIQRTTSHTLSSAIIALLAIGSAFLLLGVFIVIRACSRPGKRTHPTPSLPIFKEDFPDQFGMDDSPIFGGKERCSSEPQDSRSVWPQYQQQEAYPVSLAPETNESHHESQDAKGTGFSDAHANALAHNLQEVPTAAAREPMDLPSQMALQQARNALSRSASRLSTTSMSLYPNSPINPLNVGIAVDSPPFLAANGHAILKRTKSKSKQRDRLSLGVRDTSSWRYSQGLAYDLASPVPASQSIPAITVSGSGGRTRIKSAYYTPGTHSRLSDDPNLPSLPTCQRVIGELVEKGQQETSLEADLESRRLRETHALASAMGLSSPSPPPSPQPTIYPDDSLSRRPSLKVTPILSQKKPVSHPAATPKVNTSPSSEMNTTLGSLMLMDFGATSKTISALGYLNEPPTPSTSAASLAGLGKFKKVEDKPPRVPSPPPIPSLAQMALAHTNPSSYADYRSPTYSIYGMYQPERKRSFGY